MRIPTGPAHEPVIILDFGAQYSQLIARRVRECNVYCEILPFDTSVDEIMERRPRGVILSGGPASVYADNAPKCDRALFSAGIPVLGICYGMQLMVQSLGGRVARVDRKEFGKARLLIDDEAGIFADLGVSGTGRELVSWMSHGDMVEELPEGFETIAHTDNTAHAAIRHKERLLFGVQFHPEVIHTDKGTGMIRNFLYRVCGCSGNWTMESFINNAVREIRDRVGDGAVICGLSGGVDSSVASVLVQKAIGDQLTCIFVDHGLLRRGEAEQVVSTFRDRFNMQLVHIDAAERFLDKLEGVTDPEQKRRIIGEEFIRVFEEAASDLGPVRYLVQGTLYPDVIESGTKTAAVIKSHHNVGGLPDDMRLELVEPLRWLFKDEVRQLGEELGLPQEVIWRQPFPGPGLAVRVMGEITKEKLEIERAADAIVVEEIEKAGLKRDIWQFFAVLTDTRTVGVMGDERSYGYLVAVRAVTSTDAMTADWARLPSGVLERISNRIMNEIPSVNRVVYDISSKPPATIEWE